MRKGGFTLIELIVVITILAILGTISFMSFQGYAGETRDSKVVSDVTNIHKGLSLYKVKSGKVPAPENTEDLTLANTLKIVSYQGEISESIRDTIKVSSDGIMPDGSNYELITNGTSKYFTVQGLVEQMDNNILEINGKVRFIKGNEILSVYDENSKFVGGNIEGALPDAKAAVVGTKKLIVDGSGNIADIPTEIKENKLLSPAVSSEIAVPTIKSVASCGSTKEILYGSLDGKKESLTCSDDIIICDGVVGSGYAISACNVGSTKVGTGVDNYGKYFQWGNNYGFNSTGGDTSPTSATNSGNAAPSTYSSSTFIYGNGDWSFTRNHNLWGDADPTNEAKKGPCNTGYHIPTQSEWQEIVLNGGWGVDSTKMSNDLKLPLAGRRNWKDGVFGVGGECGFYWSSSHYGTSSYSLSFCPTSRIITNNIRYREYGYSLRCIKDK